MTLQKALQHKTESWTEEIENLDIAIASMKARRDTLENCVKELEVVLTNNITVHDITSDEAH